MRCCSSFDIEAHSWKPHASSKEFHTNVVSFTRTLKLFYWPYSQQACYNSIHMQTVVWLWLSASVWTLWSAQLNYSFVLLLDCFQFLLFPFAHLFAWHCNAFGSHTEVVHSATFVLLDGTRGYARACTCVEDPVNHHYFPAYLKTHSTLSPAYYL